MASIIDTTRIVDLPTKSSLSEGDVFVVDNENGATSKIPAAAVSGSSTAGLVAEGYSDAETYDVGEYCIHVEAGIPKLYKCTTAITTAESWTPAHWEGTDAGSEITELNSNLTDLAWGTAIEITPNIVAGYVFEVPAMGVIAGEFRKTANTNNGSIDIRSDCGITYKFLASVPPINGGYIPIHINVVRGEKITFRQFAEINFSDSHIWFQPYVRRS